MIRGFEKVQDVEGKLPERKTRWSAGYDFFIIDDIVIPPHSVSKALPTNVKAYMQYNEVLELHIRSSLGFKKGATLVNCTGIIDADYYNNPQNSGEIYAKIRNSSSNPLVLKRGDAFMQGIFKEYLESDNGNLNIKRTGGIGSTDK
jgi:dUTP pyrophosphatase